VALGTRGETVAVWCIFYEDETQISSDEATHDEVPRQGVICIVQDCPINDRRILWNSDTYCWEHDQWVQHDRFACELYLDTDEAPIRLVGYSLPNDKFQAIYKKAKEYKQSRG
jgi:hypothetical protein